MLYADTDVLFTFGDEKFSKERFSWLGGNIKQSFPVGSSKMESLFEIKNLIILKILIYL